MGRFLTEAVLAKYGGLDGAVAAVEKQFSSNRNGGNKESAIIIEEHRAHDSKDMLKNHKNLINNTLFKRYGIYGIGLVILLVIGAIVAVSVVLSTKSAVSTAQIVAGDNSSAPGNYRHSNSFGSHVYAIDASQYCSSFIRDR